MMRIRGFISLVFFLWSIPACLAQEGVKPLPAVPARLMPPVAIVFPLFLLYVYFGWVDTYFGLIILYTAFSLPYVIWMMRGFPSENTVPATERSRFSVRTVSRI